MRGGGATRNDAPIVVGSGPEDIARTLVATGFSYRAERRKLQVGSGDRSERIRTYNYPQGRVTDHRINLTLYKLEEVVSGDALGEIIDALLTEDQAQRLAELE